MSRPEPRRLSPAEQAETDRTAEAVLAHLKRVLRPGVPFDRAAHRAWEQALGSSRGHSEACDCAGCLAGVAP